MNGKNFSAGSRIHSGTSGTGPVCATMRFTPQSQSSFGSLMYTATPTTCAGSRSAATPRVANGPFLMPASLALISRALGSHGGSATS